MHNGVKQDIENAKGDKIAFLILAHDDPQMLEELVRALDYPKFGIYIHVDKKSDIKQFLFSKYNLRHATVRILASRESVHWGGYSVVQATMAMYREAIATGAYMRYVTLSGHDYPLKPLDEIYQAFSNNAIEFIAGNPTNHLHKVINYHFLDYGRVGFWASTFLRHIGITRRNPLIVDGKNHTIYFAPQWHALSHACVVYIMSQIESNPQIEHYFRFTYAPDELLIPTLVFNSAFKERCICSDYPPGTHYNEKTATHYVNYENSVQVLGINDYDILIKSSKFFARKFRSNQSGALINKLKDHIHARNEY